MNTIAINKVEKTKKLIDLPNDVCHRLAIKAAAMGTSVKRLIESIVIDSMEDTDDDTIFAYLCKTRLEGNELMSDILELSWLSISKIVYRSVSCHCCFDGLNKSRRLLAKSSYKLST